MLRKDMPRRKPETVTGLMETDELAEVVRTEDQIRRRAYEIYNSRCHNGACGDALSDWIAAEAELKVGKNGHEVAARIDSKSGRNER